MNLFNKLFDKYNFVVKEKNNWTIYAVPTSISLWIFYIAMIFVFLAFILLDSESYSDDMFEYVFDFIFLGIFIRYWFSTIRLGFKLRKAKNLKRNWMWIIKKLKVNEIAKVKVSNNNRGKDFIAYSVKTTDWDIVYYSTAHTKWKISWVSQSDLEKIYNAYWFVYDEKQSQQKDLLNFLDWEISKTEYDIQNSWLFKKIKLKRILKNLKNGRQTIETWYMPQLWEVNWNKISVWDTIDVYIDPDDSDIYWVDIDFLFDK